MIKAHKFPHNQEQTEKKSEEVKEEISMSHRSCFCVCLRASALNTHTSEMNDPQFKMIWEDFNLLKYGR